jgi:uncharacterized RDD family membrane protein YckC
VLETASWLRRLLALFVDWFACYAIVALVMGGVDELAGSAEANLYLVGLFVLEQTVFITLMGGSFGHLMTRLRVSRLDGGRVMPLQALVRSVLVALVIPPLVFRPDGRGLHDMAAGSVVHALRVTA